MQASMAASFAVVAIGAIVHAGAQTVATGEPRAAVEGRPRAGVIGTPAVCSNGRWLAGARRLERFTCMIEDEPPRRGEPVGPKQPGSGRSC